MPPSLPEATPPLLRVMVVEDERVVARDLKACLEGLGYVVPALVTSGEAAIKQAAALRPDLILMDIRLEGTMDGIEAALQIWDSLQIPVIYTTGYSDQATVERSLASTFFGYILKPVKERDLYLALQIAWQRQREREVSQQAREALVTQARASPILAALGDGVLVCDTLGRVTFLNPVAEALTGWTLADAEGQHITDVFALVDIQTQAPLPSPMTVVLQTEQTAYLVDPVLLVRRDGQRLPVADSAAPLHDANGNLSGVVIVFRDVTERELVKAFTLSEQRLQLLQQEFSQLQAQQVQKEDFLQLVSHELRTPLASIKLAVQML